MYQDQMTSYRPFGHTDAISAQEQAKWQQHIAMEQAAHSALSSPSTRGMLDVSIDGLAQSIGEAHSVIGTLTERLRLVLQPESPTPVGAGEAGLKSQPASESVHKLQALRREVEMLIGRLTSMTSRLDT